MTDKTSVSTVSSETNEGEWDGIVNINTDRLERALATSITRLATVAALTDIPTSGLVNGQRAEVVAYANGQTTGGGEFYWDATSTAMANGGTVLQASGSATGRWKRVVDGHLTPSMFGGVPGATTDQRGIVQTAWNEAAALGVEFWLDGEYWIEILAPDVPGYGVYRYGITAPNNSVARWMNGASLRVLPNDYNAYRALDFHLQHDVTIYDAVVYGDRDTHTGTEGENGHCFNVTGCRDVTLIRPKAYNAWGDGYYVGLDFYENETLANYPYLIAQRVTLIEPYSDYCSRSGIALVAGDGIRIVRPINERANRVWNKVGIDIEPEYGDVNSELNPYLRNVVIESPVSRECLSGIKALFNRPIDYCEVSITGCALDFGGQTPFEFIKSADVGPGFVKVDALWSDSSTAYPFYIGWEAAGNNILSIGEMGAYRANIENYSGYQQNAIFIEAPDATTPMGDVHIDYLNLVECPNITNVIAASPQEMPLQNFQITVAPGLAGQGKLNCQLYNTIIAKDVLFDHTMEFSASPLSQEEIMAANTELDITNNNITINLVETVKFKQCFITVGTTTNTLTLNAPTGKVIYFPTDTALVQATSIATIGPGAVIEVRDDGNGNKIVSPIAGVWTDESE
ncbi:hypothetical protein [Chromohalobacter israelensis]|uniref:hypothetical protein n=1 Tax=Chromohalobacter israelensis TaxID=141390 RepID=UPI00265C8665|nr:hypothetical protein [Chromohalobacter salexigens]MDO0946721.1 hypothetical protein [Chromohalobacter salexigens]